jgi:hypothetical protein
MANLLFAPENLTRSGLETPEGVSLHAGWYEVSSFSLTVFAGIAEFERGLIHQRTRNFPQA